MAVPYREERFVPPEEKQRWGPGAWRDEPDKVQWQDEATGLACLVVRGPAGALCGYVGVTDKHSLFGVKYSDNDWSNPVEKLRVHGGVTYTAACDPDGHICHEAEPDEEAWWIGFDCNHSDDFAPRNAELGGASYYNINGVYRDLAYVKEQCALLAAQVAKVA